MGDVVFCEHVRKCRVFDGKRVACCGMPHVISQFRLSYVFLISSQLLSLPIHSAVLLLLPVSQSDAVVTGSTAGSCDRQAGPVRSRAAINKDLLLLPLLLLLDREDRRAERKKHLFFTNVFETSFNIWFDKAVILLLCGYRVKSANILTTKLCHIYLCLTVKQFLNVKKTVCYFRQVDLFKEYGEV